METIINCAVVLSRIVCIVKGILDVRKLIRDNQPLKPK